jgi:preprotein translocase subunit SecG
LTFIEFIINILGEKLILKTCKIRSKKTNISILIIIILLFSIINIVNYDIKPSNHVSATSNWTQNAKNNSFNGTINNITITSNDGIKLGLQHSYIFDNFVNKSKISKKENVILDTSLGEIRLLRINNTIGGNGEEFIGSLMQTTDDGYLIVGDTSSFEVNSDIWVVKTNYSGNIEWQKSYGENKEEIGNFIQSTSDGGYIIVGTTDSINVGDKDIILIKINNTGSIEWQKIYGGNDKENSYFVKQTFDSGFLIIGNTKSYGSGDYDIWLIKTDYLGNMEWNKTFGGVNADFYYSAQETSDGGYIISGITESFTIGKNDVWLIKINEFGSMEWNKTFGGIGNDYSHSCQQTTDNGYIIVGQTESFGAGKFDVWLIKTNSDGIEQWNKTFGSNKNEIGNNIQQTSDNGYIIIGQKQTIGSMKNKIWLIKTDFSGNIEWNRIFNRYTESFGREVRQTSDGGYIIGGDIWSFENDYDIWLIKTDQFGNENPNGSIFSNNLLQDKNVISIDSFEYRASIPLNSVIKIQFSQDNNRWFNSNGFQNQWDLLKDGKNSINLSSLNWTGSNFYYKLDLMSDDIQVPAIQNISVLYTKHYFNFGSFISEPFNGGENITWMALNWKYLKPIGTNVKFQIKTAKNKISLLLKNFIGPDGKTSSYYNKPKQNIWSEHNNDQWIQYMVYLSTNNNSVTPILQEVSISFNNIPKLINPLITPSKGDITQKFNFSIKYIDLDNDPPKFVKICIDEFNNSMFEKDIEDKNLLNGKEFWYETKLKAGNHTIQFFTSDGESEIYTEKMNIKVDFGPLERIEIEPKFPTLDTDGYQIFTAKGYDIENNLLTISPTWIVNGGGTVDNSGNFTAKTSGTWIISAVHNEVFGNTSLLVLPSNDNNKNDKNKSDINLSDINKTKNNETVNGENKDNKNNLFMSISIAILVVVLIMIFLILYIIIMKKQKTKSNKKEDDLTNLQYQNQNQSNNHQSPTIQQPPQYLQLQTNQNHIQNYDQRQKQNKNPPSN